MDGNGTKEGECFLGSSEYINERRRDRREEIKICNAPQEAFQSVFRQRTGSDGEVPKTRRNKRRKSNGLKKVSQEGIETVIWVQVPNDNQAVWARPCHARVLVTSLFASQLLPFPNSGAHASFQEPLCSCFFAFWSDHIVKSQDRSSLGLVGSHID